MGKNFRIIKKFLIHNQATFDKNLFAMLIVDNEYFMIILLLYFIKINLTIFRI